MTKAPACAKRNGHGRFTLADGPKAAKLAHQSNTSYFFINRRLVCRFPVKCAVQEVGQAGNNFVHTCRPSRIGLPHIATAMYVRVPGIGRGAAVRKSRTGDMALAECVSSNGAHGVNSCDCELAECHSVGILS